VLFLTAGTCLQVTGQFNNTLYFMKGVPQSNRINPANQPECGLYLGFPVLSTVRGGVAFSSQTYRDLIQRHPTEDSLITFLHPLADKQSYIDRLKPVNLVAANLSTSLASFGFRTPIGFFSIGVANRLDGSLTYPADLINLMVYGVKDGRTYTLDGLGANLSLFNEVSLGWSGILSDRLQIGARAKLLLGVGNLYTSQSDVSLYTSMDRWHVESDLLINASLDFMDVQYNEDGFIEDVQIDEDIRNLNPYEIAGYAFSTGNIGFGVDLGVVYRPMERLSLNISLLDLAYIKWDQGNHQVSIKGEYEFTGIELNPFDIPGDQTVGDYLDSTFSELADSLSGFVSMGPGSPYNKRLNTKLYAGASYTIHPMITFGILSRTDFRNQITLEHITASANFALGRFLNLTLSYSYMYSNFRNIGLGIALNAGPVNLYLVSDNALNIVFWPEASQSAQFWFGLNLVFGYKKLMKGPEADRPLVY